jgi:hypothetical protein
VSVFFAPSLNLPVRPTGVSIQRTVIRRLFILWCKYYPLSYLGDFLKTVADMKRILIKWIAVLVVVGWVSQVSASLNGATEQLVDQGVVEKIYSCHESQKDNAYVLCDYRFKL